MIARALGLLAVTMIVPACSGPETQAQEAVRAVMSDPGSAKFGEFTLSESETEACLAVSGRSSSGEQGGNQQAALTKLETGWAVLGVDPISHSQCVEIINEMEAKRRGAAR